jgi:hypothetical protein
MAYQLARAVRCRKSETGLAATLRMALSSTSGAVHSTVKDIATGFVELGGGHYSHDYAGWPDGYRGTAVYYTGTVGAHATITAAVAAAAIVVRATVGVNPGDNLLANPTLTGTGDTAMDEDTGGVDNLRYVSSGVGVDAATIRVYLKSDYDAGTYTLRGKSTTKADGRWLYPVYVTAGLTYTITFAKPGAYQVSAKEVTV